MSLLGLSGSLFLGLLVLDFYHPTNRDLYSPKESSLSIVGPLGLSGSLLILDFYHPRNCERYLVVGGGVFLGEILTFSKVVSKLLPLV